MGDRPPFVPVVFDRQIVDHDPAEGVLCWGGPKNGKVVSVRRDQIRSVYRFPIMPRLSHRMADPADVFAPAIQAVEYRVEKFAWAPDEHTGEWWYVLVYLENLDTQKRQLEAAANFVVWLARWHA